MTSDSTQGFMGLVLCDLQVLNKTLNKSKHFCWCNDLDPQSQMDKISFVERYGFDTRRLFETGKGLGM